MNKQRDPWWYPADLRRVGQRAEARPARPVEPARHTLDGPERTRRRHPRHRRADVDRLQRLARLHPHAACPTRSGSSSTSASARRSSFSRQLDAELRQHGDRRRRARRGRRRSSADGPIRAPSPQTRGRAGSGPHRRVPPPIDERRQPDDEALPTRGGGEEVHYHGIVPDSLPSPDANYSSGNDYVVEFLGYRFSFSGIDFEGRVVAAAVKLGVVETLRARRGGDRRPRRARGAGRGRASRSRGSAATSCATGSASRSSRASRSSTGCAS